MYANKNKTKNSKARTVATNADSTKLSSTDSRYDAGDYEAVPASIRKIRDARNKELEEQNAIPAEEIIARQEAEIAELKRQAAAGSAPSTMADKYRNAIDDLEDHPTFKNPESMADFGDYEAVASTARFAAAERDPNQKVFRAKPSVATRKVASPSDLSPGDYEAVAAAARHAVSPDEYLAAKAEQNDNEEPAESVAQSDTSENEYMTDAEAARASRQAPSREVPEYTAPAPEPADNEVHSEPYTPPMAAQSAASSSSDEVHSEPYTPPKAPQAPPAPVSADDYTVKNYSSTNDNAVHSEPYTPPAAASSSASSSSYSSSTYVPPAQRNKYSDDGNYDVGGGPIYSPTSGKRIASFEDMAPGDYEAVADSSYDDSEMDLADGSYDFDKFLAGAPSLQTPRAPQPSPEESDWADLGPSVTEDIDDVDITDEQTRALTEAIAQETLNNQPGTQFEDIIDNVIAKVLERKKAEDAAKAAAQQPEQPEQNPEQPEQKAEEKPAEQPADEKPAEQTEAQPTAEKQTAEQPQKSAPSEVIDPSTPIEDIPALIMAQFDSADGETNDDDIRKSIDAALIGKLTTGELTLDSVQSVRNKILDEIHEMQEEEARILAQLEGKPEKHPFDPDFLPADIAVEDIPDAVIAELDNIEGEVSDDEVKESIDKVMIAKLANGELTLDDFQDARESIFDTLGIETAEEQAEETEPEPVEETEPEPVEEAVEEPTEPEPEPLEEPAEETEPEPLEETAEEEPIQGPDVELSEAEEQTEESSEELIEEPVVEPVEEPIEETAEEPVDEPVDEVAEEPVEGETAQEQAPAEDEHAQDQETSSEDEEEEEETVGILVPKEPTVLEYDPYADVFVNPKDESEEPAEDEEETDESADEDDNDEEKADEENFDDEQPVDDETVSTEEPVAETEEPEESAESEELLETPLSAAAVLAMQDQTEEAEEVEETANEEPVEETEEEPEAEEAEEPVEETEPDQVEEVEVPAEEAQPEQVEETQETEEAEEENPKAEEVEEPVEEAEEETQPEQTEESEGADKPAEEPEEHDSVLDMQITFDDIFRNPFVNDFEPLETPEEPAEEATADEAQETETDEPETESEAEEEEPAPVEEEPEPEEEPAPVEEESEQEESPTEEQEPVEEEPAQEESPTEEQAPAEDEPAQEESPAEDKAPAEEETQQDEVSEEEPTPVDEEPPQEESPAEEPEAPDEYAEAKEKRHEDMQNALLMAMIDDKEKTFSDAVNYMIDQDELNARTLRTRMPIDKDTLDRVIKERDFIPDKKTALAICFALRLTWEDSIRLLYKAGYSLNDTERYDLTIEYLMRRGVYDQNMINSVLRGSGLEGFGTPQSEI